MRKTLYIPVLAAAALLATACQGELKKIEEFQGGTVCFLPTISGSDLTAGTRSYELVSSDGSTSIPLQYTVREGIEEGTDAKTRGIQKNTGTSLEDLGTYFDSLYVKAWKGNVAFISSYELAKKGTDVWETAETHLWNATESATFYAYANVPGSIAEVKNTSSTIQTLEYSVPTSAAGQQDILLGYYQGKSRYNSTLHRGGIADLTFYHPLTAVKFMKGDFDGVSSDKVKFKSISISGVYDSGKATMTPTTMQETDPGKYFNWDTSGSTEQTVTLTPASDATYLTVASDGLIGEAFLLIPQAMTSTEKVKITVEVELDGTTSTLEAELDDNIWEAGKTNVYALGYSDTMYTFSVDVNSLVFDNTYSTLTKSINTTSYSTKISNPTGKTAVKYKAYKSTDGGNTWNNFSPVSSSSTYLQYENNGSIASESRSIYETYKNGTRVPMSYWADDMVEASEWDLSKCSVGGTYSEGNSQNTANCYIIKHPGSYKFPCVYGNAIKNGSANSAAYSTSTTGSMVLQSFVNARGNAISSPYILTDLGLTTNSDVKAALLWTDVPGLISNVRYSDGYISFETLPKTTLAEGNAVIVLYQDTDSNNAYSDGEALWSWQIWVSNSNLGSSNVFTATDTHGKQHSFMSHELGFVTGYKFTFPNSKSYIIKLVQEGSGKELYINVTRPGGSIFLPGSCTFYQYGRSVALPGLSMASPTSATTRTKIYDAGDNDISSSVHAQNNAFSSLSSGSLIGAFIANPNLTPSDSKTGTAVRPYTNLWSMNLAASLTRANYFNTDLPSVAKTVYDPCPYGYCVPNPQAFEYFLSGKSQINYADDPEFENLRFVYDGDEDKRCLFPLNSSLNRVESVRFLIGGYLSETNLSGQHLWASTFFATSALCEQSSPSHSDSEYSTIVTLKLGKGGSGYSYDYSTNQGYAVHPILEP